MCGNVFQSHTCEIAPHLLAISSGHNTQQREQSLPLCPRSNALIHWTAALLLLQQRRKKKEAIAAVFQRHERCLISLCHLSFSFQLSLSLPFICPCNLLSLLITCVTSVSHQQPSFFAFVFFFFSSPLDVQLFLHFFLSRLIRPGLTSHLFPDQAPRLSTPLCALAPNLQTVICLCHDDLQSRNLFPCRFPKQEGPPVSSLGGHEGKLARRSDNPLTPHLSSAKGKTAPT